VSLVLSLFPGIGLLDRAFEEEDFCVVRGPDLLWGGDVKTFHPPSGVFDGVIGGPPCQAFSRLSHFVRHNGLEVKENLIPEFERVVHEAAPNWFLMENVPHAPMPVVEEYEVQELILDNRWVGGEQRRRRRFSFGSLYGVRLAPEVVALESFEVLPCAAASGSTTGMLGCKTRPVLEQAVRAQGLEPETVEHLLQTMTVRGAIKAVGNGVPLPLGRAIAKAVREATSYIDSSTTTGLTRCP